MDEQRTEFTQTESRRPLRRRWPVVDGIAVLAMLPTFLAGTAGWWWLGDLFCHFRVQYVCVLLPLSVLYAARRRWRMTAALAAVLAVNVALIAPLYFGGSPSTAGGAPVRLLSANVFVGNGNTQPIIELVREERPELFLAIEVDPRWLSALDAIKDDYPYVISAMRNQGYGGFDPFGMALFSHKPATVSEVRRVGVQGLPVILAEFDLDGGASLTVIGTHPYPPVRRECAAVRDEYIAGVADIAASVEGPCVVLGDLNTTSWSPVFTRLVKRSGLRDSRHGFGIQPTWPDGNRLLRIPIDHALVSGEITVVDRRVGPSIGSDHRPLIIELGIK